MSEVVGANLEDLDRLATLFKRTADRIAQITGELDRAVGVAWSGRDADIRSGTGLNRRGEEVAAVCCQLSAFRRNEVGRLLLQAALLFPASS